MFLGGYGFPFGDQLFVYEGLFAFVVEGDGLADGVGN